MEPKMERKITYNARDSLVVTDQLLVWRSAVWGRADGIPCFLLPMVVCSGGGSGVLVMGVGVGVLWCGEQSGGQKTYNTEDSLVVTDPTTSSALTSLSRGERTGSRVLLWIWSYVAG